MGHIEARRANALAGGIFGAIFDVARAGVPTETVPGFWREFAQINPSAISYAGTHPTTAERFVRLRQAIDEIEQKREGGEELMPEFREERR